MNLTLAEPRYFKESIAVISELVTEARFKITNEGIELVAMDPANVAMVIYKLLSSSFIEYKVEQDTEVAINLNNLKAILRRANPNDTLSLDVKDNMLHITLKGKTTRKFKLPIIELEDKQQKIPQLQFGASVKTNADVLNEAVADADVVAESVAFVAEEKKFSIDAEGDLSQANIEMGEDDNTKITATEKVRSKYSLEYLKKMIGGSKLADNVTIEFGKDYPLKLEYKTVDRVLLSFILAPRVENE